MKIKFRAWDKKRQVMGNLEVNKSYLPNPFENDNWVVMQCTGLKDINDKEIYDGDIIKYYQPYSKKTATHIVKWDDMWACFGLFENGDKWCKECDWVKIQNLEILGNIYENPELLGATK